jgi:hypothetical protein
VCGDWQVRGSPPSREHSKWVPSPLVEKVNVALRLSLEMSGPDSMMVIGAVRYPTSHSYSTHWSS